MGCCVALHPMGGAGLKTTSFGTEYRKTPLPADKKRPSPRGPTEYQKENICHKETGVPEPYKYILGHIPYAISYGNAFLVTLIIRFTVVYGIQLILIRIIHLITRIIRHIRMQEFRVHSQPTQDSHVQSQPTQESHVWY